MGIYKQELNKLGIRIYTKEHNEQLLAIMELMYEGGSDITDEEFIKVIYSELADEVDDEDYYDLDYQDNCDLQTDLIVKYCIRFKVNKTLLATEIGKYIVQDAYRQFDNYEQYHTALCRALKDSNSLDIKNEFIFLSLALNEIVANDLEEVIEEEDKY